MVKAYLKVKRPKSDIAQVKHIDVFRGLDGPSPSLLSPNMSEYRRASQLQVQRVSRDTSKEPSQDLPSQLWKSCISAIRQRELIRQTQEEMPIRFTGLLRVCHVGMGHVRWMSSFGY